jgi:hypothetical protein
MHLTAGEFAFIFYAVIVIVAALFLIGKYRMRGGGGTKLPPFGDVL